MYPALVDGITPKALEKVMAHHQQFQVRRLKCKHSSFNELIVRYLDKSFP